MFEHSLTTRTNVREAYLYSGKTQKQIAEEFGVAGRTIRYWINYYKWYELKHRIHHPPASLNEGISMQLTNLQNTILSRSSGIPTLEEALIMQKLLSCQAKLHDEPALGTLITINPPGDNDTENTNTHQSKNVQASQPAISGFETPQRIDNRALSENILLPV
jgi:hypothetical protein